jgi:hypothetical protein
MAVYLPKPTAKGVQEFYRQRQTEWSERIREDKDLYALIHRRNAVEVLQEDEERNIKPIELHSGRAGGIIEHANGLVMAPPRFSHDPLGLDSEAKELSEQAEVATAKVFQKQLLANDFWPTVGKEVLSYGRTFIKALPLPSVWTAQEGYPVRGDNESGGKYLAKVRKWKAAEAKFPFIIRQVSVFDILPLLDYNDDVAASVEEKPVLAGVLADPKGMNSSVVRGLIDSGEVNWHDKLSVVEYLDSEYVGYYLASTTKVVSPQPSIIERPFGEFKELRLWKHGLGKCPVTMVTGLKTESRDYCDRYKSFLEDAREDLEIYDFLLSRLATMVGAYYLPSYIYEVSAASVASGGKDRPKLKVKLGGTTGLYEGDEKLYELPVPRDLPDANQLLAEIDSLIQRHTLEDVLFGRVEGSAPAFQISLRINVARSKLSPIALHMAGGITNVMDLLYRGVEQLGETVVIDGEELTVPMAKAARGRVTASIEPKTISDKAQDIGTAKMYAEFGMPWGWIVEKVLNEDNPAQLTLQKLMEDIEKLPPVQERQIQELLQEYDLLIEENEFTEAGALGEGVPTELTAALEMMRGGGGMGRGPFPTGAAPQTIQGGRGLRTPNEQPTPGPAQIGGTPAV